MSGLFEGLCVAKVGVGTRAAVGTGQLAVGTGHRGPVHCQGYGRGVLRNPSPNDDSTGKIKCKRQILSLLSLSIYLSLFEKLSLRVYVWLGVCVKPSGGVNLLY